jgi:hypothetical protein
MSSYVEPISRTEANFGTRDSRSGILYRRSGAAHRAAFWAGFDAIVRHELPVRRLAAGEPTSDARVCFEAGKAFGYAVLRAREST